jgi:(2Fe-2S) ferredoxin
MEDIDFPKPKLHLFVCVNDRTAIPNHEKSSCGPRIKPDDVKKVKEWIRAEGLTTTVYCTKAQCLGFCNPEGSVAVVYPKGRFVKGIQNIEDMKRLIEEELS